VAAAVRGESRLLAPAKSSAVMFMPPPPVESVGGSGASPSLIWRLTSLKKPTGPTMDRARTLPSWSYLREGEVS